MSIKKICSLSGIAVLSALASCAPAGYYDSNGHYRSYGASDGYRTNTPRSNSAPDGNVTGNATYYAPADAPVTTVRTYDRPGYYDYNGYYISSDSGPGVSKRYLPPEGMCRVWFNDRPASEEPPVESCEGIQSRVPQGAYVIYGG